MFAKYIRHLTAGVLLSGCLLILAACGTSYAGSPYLGTWLSTTAKSGDATFATSELVGQYSLTFEKNGDVQVSCSGKNETDAWKPTKHGLTLSLESGAEYPMYEEDGRLILDINSVKFTFEKQQQQ